MTAALASRLTKSPRQDLRAFAEAVLAIAASTLVGLMLAPRWGNSAVDLLYLPAVLAVAVLGGLGPALFAAALSALAYNYFFTAPYHTFRIHSPADILTVGLLFLVAVVTSKLAASIREQAQLASAHAARNATIAGLARRLLTSTSEREIADVVVKELSGLFECNATLLSAQAHPAIVAAQPDGPRLNPSDLAAVAAVAQTGRAAGRGIDRVTTVDWQLQPVSADGKVLAVVALARDDGSSAVSPDQQPLLGNLLDQAALAFERARLETEGREFAALRERDRVRAALLSSIGDDLRPRLQSIAQGVAELRRAGSIDKEVLSSIGRETAQLDRYVANLAELREGSDQRPIVAGEVSIDLFHRAVRRNGEEVRLTPKEYLILAELAKHVGRVLTHGHLLKTAWGPAQESQTEYLRVAVRGLRQKLERDPTRPTLILNEPAVGYRLAAEG